MNGEFLRLIERFAGHRILLVGDFMLDRYIYGNLRKQR